MRTLEVKFLGELESIFENALAYESGDQLGCFGEITLDKKISRYCPFNVHGSALEYIINWCNKRLVASKIYHNIINILVLMAEKRYMRVEIQK